MDCEPQAGHAPQPPGTAQAGPSTTPEPSQQSPLNAPDKVILQLQPVNTASNAAIKSAGFNPCISLTVG